MKEYYRNIQIDDSVVQEVVNQYNSSQLSQYVPLDVQNLRNGFQYFLLFLREAILFDSGKIFHDHVLWFLRTNVKAPVSQQVLINMLEKIKVIIEQQYDKVFAKRAIRIVDSVLTVLPIQQKRQKSYFFQPHVDEDSSRRYLESLLALDILQAELIIKENIEKGRTIKTLYTSIFQPVQYEIGRLWENGDMSIAEEHFCTDHTRRIIASMMTQRGKKETLPVFLGMCVEHESHSLGIQIVTDYFSLEGWKGICLGANVPSDGDLLLLIEKYCVSVIGISVTMPYHIHEAAEIIQKIRSHSEFHGIKVLVGGLVFNSYPDLYIKVGADAHARNAEEAVNIGTMHIVQSYQERSCNQ